LLTGKPFEECKEFLEGLATMLVMDYQESGTTRIPLVGDVSITYNGDEMTPEGKVAIVEVDVEPDHFMRRTVGQIQDGVENDLERLQKERIRKIFEKFN
jgi:hypothetical protein